MFKALDDTLHQTLGETETHVLNVGGSFNPAHSWHLHLALAGFEAGLAYDLQRYADIEKLLAFMPKWVVVFMIAKQNVLKKQVPIACTDRIRLLESMLRAKAFKSQLQTCFERQLRKNFLSITETQIKKISSDAISCVVGTFEIQHEGASYTYSTLKAYRSYPSIKKLNVILGNEAALTLPKWYRANDCLLLIDRLFVTPRGSIDKRWQAENTEAGFCNALREKTHGTDFNISLFLEILVYLSDFKIGTVTASLLRERIQQKDWTFVSEYLCKESLDLIRAKALYQNG